MAVLDKFQYQGIDAIRVGRFNLGINSSFILYRLGNTLIDTGPTNQWRYVKPFVEEKPLQQLILTHHHEDHSGNAGRIKTLTNITPLAPELTVQKLKRGFRIPITQRILWGAADRVEAAVIPQDLCLADGERVESIFTPGHAKDMTCYLLPERGWLFSADLYIANHLKLLRVDEDIATILESTKRVLALEFDTIICPHRGIVKDGKQRLQEKYDYIVNLAAEVQQLHQQGYSQKAITLQLLGKENLMSRLSGYNFSKINLIRSCQKVVL
ncbi:MBL fold metallo-hydrolase [Pseudomaricurvus alkylphenolicus]|uniref:MBL fold metallo-hydrolase n=1 Tax=Pseudomaricurvus alkylphenolicus TaxID=1306991 RepID=UPI00141FAA9E|nr:MBL fold metallo-hydrolase [Pseudomaricurvus alkylphenolicus]NIB41056.1 MBL fold metallo-hydrolase [Pseudomaricurvus alkylphenolicus]